MLRQLSRQPTVKAIIGHHKRTALRIQPLPAVILLPLLSPSAPAPPMRHLIFGCSATSLAQAPPNPSNHPHRAAL
jgi:hypothetical protein